jgi:uncharacterized delta-60 repeat protein
MGSISIFLINQNTMKKFYFLLFLIVPFLVSGQNPGDLAQSYGVYPGFNGPVLAIVPQANGKILLGGAFSSYNGVTENGIIRLNADGTKDITFNTGTGFNSQISAIVVQADGKILVGGDFTSFNGTTENRIIRLNADGTKDTTFSTGTGLNSTVSAIAVQADGKIIVGGGFFTYQGVTENRIIRLNADGTKDTTFSTGTGFDGDVYTIALQTDGKILVGGQFFFYNGVLSKYIMRLNANGTKDTSFIITGNGFDQAVMVIALQANGKILVGGSFNAYNSTTENYIIRLNAEGTKDFSFSSGTGFNSGFNSTVRTIALQADGKVLIGGQFTSYKGITENRIIRLNADGMKDSTFTTGTGFNAVPGTTPVSTIALQADGQILVGGLFTAYNGDSENRIIRLSANGTNNSSFSTGTGFNVSVRVITPQADGKILVGGAFTSYNGAIDNRIVLLNANGTKDTAFNSGVGFDGSVFAIVPQADGKVLVGGEFTSYKGITENRIIRLNADGTKDISFITGTGFSNTVWAIVPQPDGKILIGGLFTSYNGTSENRIIRLNANGTKDTSFITGTGFNNTVRAIALQADGKILAVGNFNAYNGTSENHIIRLNANGTKDTTFNTGIGFNTSARAIVLQADGKILVGGSFTAYNGITENYIIRLNAEGTKDTTFNIGTGFNESVWGIAPQADGKILVAGSFTAYGGVTENYFIRLNAEGTKDSTFNTGTGFDNAVLVIASQPDGKILLGGDFITYKGNNSSAHLIALHSEASLTIPSINESNSFIIYPNPVNDLLYLHSNNFLTIKSVKIVDLQGKIILEDTNETINVSHLTNGLYIIKVITEGGEFIKKFIKQ